MIHVVTHDQTDRYTVQLDRMYKLLHQVYVANRDWDLDEANGRVRDHSLPQSAIYLMRLEAEKDVSAAIRLTPSEDRPLNSPQAYDKAMLGMPAGPGIWDANQFCMRKSEMGHLTVGELATGAVEFALTWGIGTVCFLIDRDFERAMRLLPLRVHLADNVVELCGEEFIPAALPISADTLKCLRMITGIQSSQLHMTSNNWTAERTSTPKLLYA